MKVLIMGVSGCGKSTVAKRLSQHYNIPFIEGDDFHSEKNKSKMAAGFALTDEDRWPWLDLLFEALTKFESCVLACSALKESYRSLLTQEGGIDTIIYLQGSKSLIESRLAKRDHEYMPASLLQSQFDVLEVSEDICMIPIDTTPKQIVQQIITFINDKK